MCDEENRHPEFALQIIQQLQNLRLHSDVERARGLVGDEKLRPAGERHRDHGPLTLTSGKLMRIGPALALRGADGAALEQFLGTPARGLAPKRQMRHQDLGDLVTDPVEGIQRGPRFLEDHGDLPAAQRAHHLLICLQQLVILKTDAACVACARKELEQRQGQDRLA